MASGSQNLTTYKANLLAHTPNDTSLFLRGDNIWTNTLNGTFTVNDGYLKSTAHENTVTIGSQNTGWCHIINSTDVHFYFKPSVCVDGDIYPYTNNTRNCGTSSNKWASCYATNFYGNLTGNAATATRIDGNLVAATSDVSRNIWISSTASADGIPNYISGFYINPSTKEFGVPSDTRIYPQAGALYLGNSGNQSWVYIQDMCSQDGQKWKIHQGGNAEFTGIVTAPTFSGNATSASHATTFGSAAACRVYFHNSDECNFAGSNTSTNLYFNYRAVGEGRPIPSNFIFGGSAGTATIKAGKVLNAVWNDFAEFRAVDIKEPGYAVIPTSTGIATKSTQRLQVGAHIISDTYGCAVGESDTATTPLGVAGRVLAYTYKNREEYNIGDCVCTAPNGTVDIMTREEIMMYPECIIGIVNEIPNYEFWEQTLTALDPKKQGGAANLLYKKQKSKVVSGQISNNSKQLSCYLAA